MLVLALCRAGEGGLDGRATEVSTAARVSINILWRARKSHDRLGYPETRLPTTRVAERLREACRTPDRSGVRPHDGAWC